MYSLGLDSPAAREYLQRPLSLIARVDTSTPIRAINPLAITPATVSLEDVNSPITSSMRGWFHADRRTDPRRALARRPGAGDSPGPPSTSRTDPSALARGRSLSLPGRLAPAAVLAGARPSLVLAVRSGWFAPCRGFAPW